MNAFATCLLGAGLGQQDVSFRGMFARQHVAEKSALVPHVFHNVSICFVFNLQVCDLPTMTMTTMTTMTEHFVCICSKGPLGGFGPLFSALFLLLLFLVVVSSDAFEPLLRRAMLSSLSSDKELSFVWYLVLGD